MPALPVWSLRARPCRLFQRSFKVVFCDSFHVVSRRQRGGLEVPTKISTQGLPIRDKPRFHALHHELCAVIRSGRGLGPVVAFSQMFPRVIPSYDCGLAIHQENDEIAGLGAINGRTKLAICALPGTASDNPRHAALKPGLAKKLSEAIATLSSQWTSVSTALDIYLDAHQGFPPISPLLQSSPSR